MAGQHHPGVEIEKFRIGFLYSGDDLTDFFPDDILQPGQFLKSTVDIPVDDVPDSVLLKLDLEIDATSQHVLKERAIPELTFRNRQFRPLSLGDVANDF